MFKFKIHRVRGPECLQARLPRPLMLSLLVTLSSLALLGLSLFILIQAAQELQGYWMFDSKTGTRTLFKSPHTGINVSYISHAALFILGSVLSLVLSAMVVFRGRGDIEQNIVDIETKGGILSESKQSCLVTIFHLLPYTFLITGLIDIVSNPFSIFSILAPLFNLICVRVWFICVCNLFDDKHKPCNNITSNMRKILVTGGNTEIGLAIVKKLLRDSPDTFVLLGSPDISQGHAALEDVIGDLTSSIKSRIELIQLDVCSDKRVTASLETVKSKHGQLYGVINNAGGVFEVARRTVDLNIYGIVKVTEAFIPIVKSPGGRVVQISSAAGPNWVSKCSREIQDLLVNKDVTFSEIDERGLKPYLKIKEDTNISEDKKHKDLQEIGLNDSWFAGAGYGVSKACLNAYTTELARRFPGILINSCTPGVIETVENSGKRPAVIGLKSPEDEEGTKAAVYLMMGDLEADIPGYESGRYYGSDAVRSPLHRYRGPGEPAYEGEYP